MTELTIVSEVDRWLALSNGPPERDDPDTWDFYNDDIKHLTSEPAELEEARRRLNLHIQPSAFCDRCNDEGWVYHGLNAYRCPVCKGEPSPDILYRQAHVPPLFKSYRTFQTYNEQPLVAAKHQVGLFVTNYKPGQGLLLMGQVGVGKTHLAVGVIRALTLQKVRCEFWDIDDWLDQLRESYACNESHELLDAVKSVELLVFDDLGAQRMTDHTADRLFDVINHRYNHQLSTVITTNIKPTQIENTYGPRVWSRLMQMCQVITVDSIDHRQRGKPKEKKGLFK